MRFCEEAYEEKLYEMQHKGIIIYHGMIRDVRKFSVIYTCNTSDILPGGIVNVLLEGAASARPIITTNRAGCREVVVNGVNGYLIEEKSTSELIEKIELFLKLSYEEKKRMGIEGRKKVQAEYDRKIVVNKYWEELLRIC